MRPCASCLEATAMCRDQFDHMENLASKFGNLTNAMDAQAAGDGQFYSARIGTGVSFPIYALKRIFSSLSAGRIVASALFWTANAGFIARPAVMASVVGAAHWMRVKRALV